MKLYTCTNFKGHWPVGVAAIILAENRQMAEALLRIELHAVGLKQDDRELRLKEVPFTPGAIILASGEY